MANTIQKLKLKIFPDIAKKSHHAAEVNVEQINRHAWKTKKSQIQLFNRLNLDRNSTAKPPRGAV